jgi:hypothetical protein
MHNCTYNKYLKHDDLPLSSAYSIIIIGLLLFVLVGITMHVWNLPFFKDLFQFLILASLILVSRGIKIIFINTITNKMAKIFYITQFLIFFTFIVFGLKIYSSLDNPPTIN